MGRAARQAGMFQRRSTMVRHIVMLNFKEGFSAEENRKNAEQVKFLLEGLKKTIPGIMEFKVIIDALPTSDRDIVFNTLFESVEALAAYQIHPEHVRVASYAASVLRNRACIDYYE
jgi:hypothetical protein